MRLKWVGGELVDLDAPSDNRSEQQRLVDAVSGALSDEVPLQGKDAGWTLIGGIKLGQAIVIKDTDGTGLFELSVKARRGVNLDFDRSSIFPVLLKRFQDGSVERVSVDFSSTMDFTNQPTPEEFSKLVNLGFIKSKP